MDARELQLDAQTSVSYPEFLPWFHLFLPLSLPDPGAPVKTGAGLVRHHVLGIIGRWGNCVAPSTKRHLTQRKKKNQTAAATSRPNATQAQAGTLRGLAEVDDSGRSGRAASSRVHHQQKLASAEVILPQYGHGFIFGGV